VCLARRRLNCLGGARHRPGGARHRPGPAQRAGAQARTAALAASGGTGQSVTLGVVAQAGYAGLGHVVADGVVHRCLLGVAWWAVFSEDLADWHLAPRVAVSPASGGKANPLPRDVFGIK